MADDKTYTEEYVKKLTDSLAAEREKAKKLASDFEAMQKKFEGFDPEEFKAFQAEKAKAEEERIKKEGAWAEQKEQILKAHEKALKAKDDEIAKLKEQTASLDTELQTTLLSSAIAREAARTKCLNPSLIELAVKGKTLVERLEDGKRVIKVLDDKGNVRVDEKGEPFTVGALLDEMKQTADYAPLFEGGRVGGGSSTRNGQPNVDVSKMSAFERAMHERNTLFADK